MPTIMNQLSISNYLRSIKAEDAILFKMQNQLSDWNEARFGKIV
jgi:hypothetical protein